jgi:hypothetical protein
MKVTSGGFDRYVVRPLLCITLLGTALDASHLPCMTPHPDPAVFRPQMRVSRLLSIGIGNGFLMVSIYKHLLTERGCVDSIALQTSPIRFSF